MKKQVLYEPWAMGDSIIAASMLLLMQDYKQYVLACQESWQPLISHALNLENVQFFSVSLAYTAKNKGRDLRISQSPSDEQTRTIDRFAV